MGTVTGRKHAPALAFAVLEWSLIGPPPLQNSWWYAYWRWSTRDRWDLAAPLSQWITRDTFGTLESCRSALAMMRQENATYLASSIDAWQCVAADDAHTEVTSASDD